MKPRIIVFDKFLGYQVGGAQRSLETLLERLSADFKFIGCRVKKSFSAERLKSGKFPVERLNLKEIPCLPYLEYFLNRKKITEFISRQKGDCLFAQSFWAPMAVNSFRGRTVYFVRDEYSLNHIANYYSGSKFWLKKIYILLQYPFVKCFFSDNKKALERADLLIANSIFMKDLIEKKFNRQAEVIYPIVDTETLRKITVPGREKRPFLTLIGSEIIKGRPVIEEIAKKMNSYKFMLVGRNFRKPFWKKNIFYCPWSKNPLEIYEKTKIILIPSLCEEAFCRAAVEAAALGIPCLGARKGGIPEFLPSQFLIDNVWDIAMWVRKIKETEESYEVFSQMLKNRAKLFRAEAQIEKFRKIIKEKFNFYL